VARPWLDRLGRVSQERLAPGQTSVSFGPWLSTVVRPWLDRLGRVCQERLAPGQTSVSFGPWLSTVSRPWLDRLGRVCQERLAPGGGFYLRQTGSQMTGIPNARTIRAMSGTGLSIPCPFLSSRGDERKGSELSEQFPEQTLHPLPLPLVAERRKKGVRAIRTVSREDSPSPAPSSRRGATKGKGLSYPNSFPSRLSRRGATKGKGLSYPNRFPSRLSRRGATKERGPNQPSDVRNRTLHPLPLPLVAERRKERV
jgi:hypothetical protein